MQFVGPSLSHPSRWLRACWPTKFQKQGWASWPEFRVLFLGLPADTTLLGKTARLWAFLVPPGKGLDHKREAFLRPPGWVAPRMEYVVPCSMQSQFPYLWSALLQSPHWMPIHGDPGAHEMGVPSRNGDPQRAQLGTPPPLPRPDPRPSPPGLALPLVCPWSLPSCKGDRREHIWDPRPRSTTRPPTRASRVGPAPGALPVRSPPSPRAMGEPHPHARFQERLLDLFHLLPLGETRGQVNLPRWFNG